MAKVRGALVFFAFAGLFLLVTVVAHEFGHALTARLLGSQDVAVYVWPGFQVYPKLGGKSRDRWLGSAIALTDIGAMQEHAVPVRVSASSAPIYVQERSLPVGIQFSPFPIVKEPISPAPGRFIPARGVALSKSSTGLIQLMGSGFTLIISLVCLPLLFLLKPSGILLRMLSAGSLLYYDLFTYTAFPYFFDAPHLLIAGGRVAEPLIGLENLGMGVSLAVPLILALSLALSLLVYRGCQRSTSRAAPN
jgi:hypothetical protein